MKNTEISREEFVTRLQLRRDSLQKFFKENKTHLDTYMFTVMQIIGAFNLLVNKLITDESKDKNSKKG